MPARVFLFLEAGLRYWRSVGRGQGTLLCDMVGAKDWPDASDWWAGDFCRS